MSTRHLPARSNLRPPRQQGYILLTLVLMMAVMSIAAGAIASSLAFQIKRDREEEMVHRGVQYSRAIRNFVKKTGRYPSRLEELQDTNGQKFIRKLYKDPITGHDFKLLHMSDVASLGAPPNLNSSNPQSGPNGALAPADAADAADSDASGNPDPASASSAATVSQPGPAAAATNASPTSNSFKAAPSADVQPGLLIFGVASTSKAKTIREFDHKNHYKDWLFFYDPKYDRGYEIKGPTSLTLPNFSLPGQPGGQSQPTAGSNQPSPTSPPQQ
jgi:type II secretory pathway pseudopilin PulG